MKRGRGSSRWLLVASLVLGVGASPARAQWQKNEYQLQKEWAAKFEPAPLLAPRRSGGGPLQILRVRFHADSDYRSSSARWSDRIKVQLLEMNRTLEPAFGVRLEAESFKRWERGGGNGALGPMLDELERLDAGADVDWVVGLVSPLPLVSMSFHDLGRARILGRHFVVRGMSSVAEMKDFDRIFGALEASFREQLYSRRKSHKEMSVFLHEWGHTLGAFHIEEPTRIMSPGYSQRTSSFNEHDAGLIAAALGARLAARASGSAVVDWTPLRAFVLDTRNPEWREDERKTLLDYAGALDKAARAGGGTRTGRPAAPPVPAPPGLASSSRPPPERVPGPGGSPLPEAPPAPGAPGAPVESAFAAEARALLGQQKRAEALAVLNAAAEAGGRSGVDPARLAALARLYAEAGALSAAEQALARAGDGEVARAAARDVLRARRRLGLPAGAPFHLAAEAEPTFAEAVEGARRLMNAGQLAEAQAALDRGLLEFPRGPGLLTVSCELLLRQERPKPAGKRCAEAIAAMEEQPRAHYALGCAQSELGAPERAIASLKRAITLDDSDRSFWDALGELYRSLGRQREFSKFMLDHDGGAAAPAR